MDKAYLVSGTCGEYSDYRIWQVKAFLSKNKADKFCAVLNEWCITNDADESRVYDIKCPYDPNIMTDCTGTKYLVQETELDDFTEFDLGEEDEEES